jgi:hypothetical protein
VSRKSDPVVNTEVLESVCAFTLLLDLLLKKNPLANIIKF